MSIDVMKQALNKAFQLGLRYESWADSEYPCHWKKADTAKAEFDKLVEAVLRLAIEQAEKQEPVASVHIKGGCLAGSHRKKGAPLPDGHYGLWPIESYTAPPSPQRQPLTEEEIYELVPSPVPVVAVGYLKTFARAIERAHEIGDEK